MAHSAPQLIRIWRFGQVVVGSVLQSTHRRLHVRWSSQDKHAAGAADGANTLQKLPVTQSAELQGGDDQVEILARHPSKGSSQGQDVCHTITHASEVPGDGV